MTSCKELKDRIAFLKKQFREASDDTPEDVIWEWIKEFDRLMAVLENSIANNNTFSFSGAI